MTRQWKFVGAAVFGAALFGCNNLESGLVILHVAAPEDDATCEFNADGDTFLADIHFDSELANTMFLNLRVENTLQSGQVDFTEDESVPDTYSIRNGVTPLRFDLRWECDSNGFSSNLGALYLPQFSATEPFCLDNREDASEDFAGFDVIPANGAIIAPGGRGLATIRPITAQLGMAFRDFFEIATTAEMCCSKEAPLGCTDALLADKVDNGQSCQKLQRLFEATSGGGFSATNAEDVTRFRSFAIFDVRPGTPGAEIRGASQILGPSYPLRMHGVLEGVTESGNLVTSADFSEIIHVCRDCTGRSGGSACTQL